jgi:hypothetical protein
LSKKTTIENQIISDVDDGDGDGDSDGDDSED